MSLRIFLVYLIFVLSRSVVSDSFWPHGLYPTRLLCPWDFSDKNTGVGCRSLLQGIFSTPRSNPYLLHWQVDSLPLSHLGSPMNARYHYVSHTLILIFVMTPVYGDDSLYMEIWGSERVSDLPKAAQLLYSFARAAMAKYPPAWVAKQQQFIFSQFQRLEAQVWGVSRLAFSESSPIALQMAAFSHGLSCVWAYFWCRCIQTSSSYKDISHIGFGLKLMTSF